MMDVQTSSFTSPPKLIDRPIQEKSWLKLICLAPALLYDGVFFLGPLLFLVWIGFWTTENYQAIPGFSLSNYLDVISQLFAKSSYALAIGQSIWVATTTTILALALCYPFAFALVFLIPEQYQRFTLLLAIAPFWSSYILRLYSWQTIITKNGILNSFLKELGWIQDPILIIHTQTATRLGLVHYLAPIFILILFLVLRNIDPHLIEAARDLGATRLQTFRRVILPLSRMGIITCSLFGMLISLGDVLSGIILGGGAGRSIFGRIPLFSGVILNEYSASTNLPRTSALATLLVLIMLGFMAGFARLARENE